MEPQVWVTKKKLCYAQPQGPSANTRAMPCERCRARRSCGGPWRMYTGGSAARVACGRPCIDSCTSFCNGVTRSCRGQPPTSAARSLLLLSKPSSTHLCPRTRQWWTASTCATASDADWCTWVHLVRASGRPRRWTSAGRLQQSRMRTRTDHAPCMP